MLVVARAAAPQWLEAWVLRAVEEHKGDRDSTCGPSSSSGRDLSGPEVGYSGEGRERTRASRQPSGCEEPSSKPRDCETPRGAPLAGHTTAMEPDVAAAVAMGVLFPLLQLAAERDVGAGTPALAFCACAPASAAVALADRLAACTWADCERSSSCLTAALVLAALVLAA